MSPARIPVLLVEDSSTCLAILKQMLSTSAEVEVVGTAKNGKEALELIPRLQPAVICTDLDMPVMDGFELTREVMARYPRPILVVSNYVQKEDTHNVFRLLEIGAVDVFPKPRGGDAAEFHQHTQDLITKIKILSGVVVHRRRPAHPTVSAGLGGPRPAPAKRTGCRLVVLGASTGGPAALRAILSRLPADFPVPVLCVQHISEGFLQGLVEWLSSGSPMPVKVAQAGETPVAGTVYFPPEKTHLELDEAGRLVVSTAPPLGGHRPSVDVTFRSAARLYGGSTVGVLLTGMGKDGATGLLEIAKSGGPTIAQDEQTCVVFGMPQQAIALGAAAHVLSLDDIAPMLISTVSA